MSIDTSSESSRGTVSVPLSRAHKAELHLARRQSGQWSYLPDVQMARNDATAALPGELPRSATGFSAYALYKRAFDVVFSATFLVFVGSWLFPLIAAAIRLDTRGPAFFRQMRVGKDGQLFECLKFRTMQHRDAAFVQATRDDPRITRVGRFLRKTNLDEFPQFVNVLRGDMTIVGPRPHVKNLDDRFGQCIPNYPVRHSVKPGITGLAQVLGHRGETRSVRDMAHRVRLDSLYVRNASAWLDLRLIALTVLVVLRGDDNAY